MSPIALVRENVVVRRLFIAFSWLTLLVGVVVYLNTRTDSAARTAAGPPAPSAESQFGRKIPVPPAALSTARSFLSDAVLRKDLAAAWDEAAPSLRSGFTRQRWLTGDIPVAQYPAQAFGQARYKVVRSRQRDVLLIVYIAPAKGSTVPGWDYFAELVPRDGRWLVSYWQSRGHAGPVPQAAN